MNRATISKLVDELRSCALGHEVIRAISSGPNEVVLHLRDAEPPFILVSCDPRFHRLIPVKRKLKEIERSTSQSQFSLHLNRDLNGTFLAEVRMLPDERIVILVFTLGDSASQMTSIVVQLTGRSSNLFLVDADQRIVSRMRETSGDGQDVGSIYAPPSTTSGSRRAEIAEDFPMQGDETFADAVDRFYETLLEQERVTSDANAVRAKLNSKLKKVVRLAESLKTDLNAHGDPEEWKRLGDLLLAQSTSARREGDQVLVTDYFDPEAPEIAISGDRNKSITQLAEEFFKKYVKARNARDLLQNRISSAENEIESIRDRLAELEQSIEDGTFIAHQRTESRQKASKKEPSKTNKTRSPFRRFVSSDGFDILVGKGSRDNDELTFKVAKSLDLWLHAADYPGSHVIVRGAGKKEIPQSTLIEAAKLAAFYSDAKEHPKAAVHHTQRKFVSKIKGAAPGMVRLSSFKTVMVEPEVPPNLSRD